MQGVEMMSGKAHYITDVLETDGAGNKASVKLYTCRLCVRVVSNTT